MRAWVHRNAALLFMCAGLTGLFVVGQIENDSQDSKRDARTIAIAVTSCHRTNIIRARQNINASITYWELTKDGAAHFKASRHESHLVAWTPLTLCIEATIDPLHYRGPDPILFYQHRAPRSAFVLGPEN